MQQKGKRPSRENKRPAVPAEGNMHDMMPCHITRASTSAAERLDKLDHMREHEQHNHNKWHSHKP
jgi:hypothetical protein